MKKAAILLALLSIAVSAQGTFTDPRDKKKYKTVKIGDQLWMATNLDYRGTDGNLGKCYEDKPANCTKYGRLYTQAAAKTACPTGWLLPNEDEWYNLVKFASEERDSLAINPNYSVDLTFIGNQLRAKSGWPIRKHPSFGTTENFNGKDKYGLSLLPSGMCDSNGCVEIGESGYWWNSDNDQCRFTSPGLGNFGFEASETKDNSDLFSVRCVQVIEKEREKLKQAAEAVRAKAEAARLKAEQAKAEKEKVKAEQAKAEAERVKAEQSAGPIKAGIVKASLSTFTDSRNKKTYKKITVGHRDWMAENLNYNATGSKCYDNKEANCTKYGRLYNWATAQKACPAGWHLPTAAEWTTLENIAGGEKTAGNKLKSSDKWDGTDDFGFSALPGGFSFLDLDDGKYTFRTEGGRGFWWSDTEDFTKENVSGVLIQNICGGPFCDKTSEMEVYGKTDMLSVRCIKELSEAEQAQAKAERVKLEAEVAKQEAAQAAAEAAKAKAEAERLAAMQFTDSRDKKAYKKATIGKQTWMAENLSFAAEGSKCYDNKEDNCAKYGRLYNWETAQKSCPAGWHLPTKEEYGELDKAAGGEKTAGKKLKATSGWNKNGNGTDDYGFSALPGGFGKPDGKFSSIDTYGGWWGAGEHNSTDGRNRRIVSDNDGALWGNYNKSGLFAVRCVQN